MILLGIDTAGPRLQLALMRETGTVDTLIEDLAKGHAEIVFGRIEKLLSHNGVTYQDLGRIAVTTGPGSFTGLRIGMSAARGLGLALEIPVIGVPSLLAISLQGVSGSPSLPFSVAVPAGRGATYYQAFIAPGVPDGEAQLVGTDGLGDGRQILGGPFCDVERLAVFAAVADPDAFPPNPTYVRDADAKPQDKARIARQS